MAPHAGGVERGRFFEGEEDQLQRPLRAEIPQGAAQLEQHGDAAGVVVGPRGPLDRVVVGADDDGLVAPLTALDRHDEVLIGPPLELEGLPIHGDALMLQDGQDVFLRPGQPILLEGAAGPDRHAEMVHMVVETLRRPGGRAPAVDGPDGIGHSDPDHGGHQEPGDDDKQDEQGVDHFSSHGRPSDWSQPRHCCTGRPGFSSVLGVAEGVSRRSAAAGGNNPFPAANRSGIMAYVGRRDR